MEKERIKELLLTSIIVFSLCIGSLPTIAQNTFSRTNNEIADEITKFKVNQSRENICFSPLLITSMLTWLQSGASGETLSEIMSITKTNRPHEFFDAWNTLVNDQNRSQLSLSNALWPAKGFIIEPSFIQSSNYIGAKIQEVDYGQTEETRSIINEYISEKTDGEIKEMLPKNSITSGTKLGLTNTLYFQGSWLFPFEEEFTYTGEFVSSEDKTFQCSYMMQEDVHRKFIITETYVGVDLPFGGDFSLSLILPTDEKQSISDFMNSFKFENLSSQLQKSHENSFSKLVIPKFKISHELDLVDIWSYMGLESAFGNQANFDKISQGIFISNALHKTVFEIDEKGATAASATAVFIGKSLGMPMIFDRPFIYAIYDHTNKLFLLVGIYNHPE